MGRSPATPLPDFSCPRLRGRWAGRGRGTFMSPRRLYYANNRGNAAREADYKSLRLAGFPLHCSSVSLTVRCIEEAPLVAPVVFLMNAGNPIRTTRNR